MKGSRYCLRSLQSREYAALAPLSRMLISRLFDRLTL